MRKIATKLIPILVSALASLIWLSSANSDSSAQQKPDISQTPETARARSINTENVPFKAHGYYVRGDLLGAIKVLEEATRDDPDDAQLHFMLGNAYFRQARWDDAVDEYQQAAKIRPRHPDTHLGLGYALYRADLGQKATTSWRIALQQTPADALMHLSLAIGLIDQGQELRAMQHVAYAIRVDPTWHRRLSIDVRWTPEMLDEINILVKKLEGS